MLSLDEIATRSIYTKLGVTSRRMAVLSAHEHGLLTSIRPS
jgi:LuxR family transcriptional regulator, maltose regulon positive regulatory protein